MRSGVQKRMASASDQSSSPVFGSVEPPALADGEAEGSPVPFGVEGPADAEGAGSTDGPADVPADGTVVADRWGAGVTS
ncbi:hypothetical protein D9753_35510 [Streptomyces dangxiongensis]|uniref:Uncharacterized protein n=1 Tax=Streptomyces dangxiongensis TaxID=1442032 RepID=A0A3G2JLI6_9ACTN|nr:hypothetical protein D9753_35510 [Streptomyces dangxiongensis]